MQQRTVIKSRFYKVKSINVEVSLIRVEQGMDIRFIIVERFQGEKYKNEIVRGVFNDQGIARVEYKNVICNLERLLPAHVPEMAY